jgi:hypothetical protein
LCITDRFISLVSPRAERGICGSAGLCSCRSPAPLGMTAWMFQPVPSIWMLTLLLNDTRSRPVVAGVLVAGAIAAGLLIGVPAGILADFKWFAYSSFAYTSCLAAVAIGYSERKNGARTPLLAQVLLLAMPLVAVYGIYQYFAGLPSWDLDFLRSVTVFDGGLDAPGDPGHWRVFSTLKHPDTLAALLAVAIVLVLAARKFTAAHWLALPLLPVLAAGAVRRDGRSGIVLLFLGVQYLPWLAVARPVFSFYAVPLVPFVAAGIAVAVARLDEGNRSRGAGGGGRGGRAAAAPPPRPPGEG